MRLRSLWGVIAILALTGCSGGGGGNGAQSAGAGAAAPGAGAPAANPPADQTPIAGVGISSAFSPAEDDGITPPPSGIETFVAAIHDPTQIVYGEQLQVPPLPVGSSSVATDLAPAVHTTAVPEPVGLWLSLIGLAGAIGYLTRRVHRSC